MSEVKYLLFDADGVLLFHTDKMFSERIIDEYGADAASVADFFANVFPDCLVGKKDTREELSSRLNSWNWPGTIDELLDYWHTYEHNADQSLLEYVRQIGKKGICASIATNNDRYRAQAIWNYLNVDGTVFDALYAAAGLGAAKPDRVFFQKVVDDLPHLRPAEILFWDDSLENVTGAREFGMQAERYTTFEAFEETMKRYV